MGIIAPTLRVAPPSGLPAWRGNEPAGMTPIGTQDFTSMPSGGWAYFSNASTQSDPTAPRSPSSVMFVNVTAPSNSEGFVEKAIADYRTVYFCKWFKIGAAWQGHLTSTNKFGFIYTHSGGVSENKFFWRGAGTGSNPLQVGIALQAIVSGGNFDGGVTGLYDSNLLPSVVHRRGQWDLVECVATCNTVGNADGSVDMWLNGQHCTSCSGIKFTNDSNPNWYIFQPNCLWGGGGDSISSPGSNTYEIDEIYVSGKH